MMENYWEEMDEMLNAGMFGATFEEQLALAGITVDEFFADCEEEGKKEN